MPNPWNVGSPARSKKLKLRRADRCVVCERDLPAGEEAVWHPDLRHVTCLGCEAKHGEVVVGEAGASALREYERRHQRREDHARSKLGRLGVALARVIDEPTSTKVWRQGGRGEVRTAARLAKHLAGTGLRLLHDRRIPGHGQANIDHLAIGPGGVTAFVLAVTRASVSAGSIGRTESCQWVSRACGESQGWNPLSATSCLRAGAVLRGGGVDLLSTRRSRLELLLESPHVAACRRTMSGTRSLPIP
jgi:hypothetical protein